MGIFSSLLCLAAIRLQAPTFAQHYPIQILLLCVLIFCGMSATMLWNDWEDRHHDVQKGKLHAAKHPEQYIRLARWLWIITAVCSERLQPNQPWVILGIGCFCLVGIGYALTYSVPLLPMLVVGITSAAVTLFALFIPDPRALSLGIALFFGVSITICSREILKDIEDVAIDPGYKATMPVLWGTSRSVRIAGWMLLVGGIILTPFVWTSVLLVMPISMVISSACIFFTQQPEKIGKLTIDLGTLALLVTLLAVPMGSR